MVSKVGFSGEVVVADGDAWELYFALAPVVQVRGHFEIEISSYTSDEVKEECVNSSEKQ